MIRERVTAGWAYDSPEVAVMPANQAEATTIEFGRQRLFLADCIDWLGSAEPNSVTAVVTDPPYGLVEYEPLQQQKLRAGRGGVWRIPPSFDGAKRRPLPRFTVLAPEARAEISVFFTKWALALRPALRPGGMS